MLKVVMYHYTRDLQNSRYPQIKGLDRKLFEQQLDYFQKNAHVVTMEAVVEAWNGGKKLPEDAVLLTFDDGYIDNYLTAFPLLAKRGMQGSFFIPGRTITENVLLDVNKIHFVLASANREELLKDLLERMNAYRENNRYQENDILYDQYAVATRFDHKDTIFIKRMLQTVLPEEIRTQIASELFAKYVGIEEQKFAKELYLDRDQIRVMQKNGMYIGTHSYDHYWLANLSKDKLKTEMDKMKDIMDEFIDSDCWVMNYPYGNYNQDVIECIEERGCKLALTTKVKAAVPGEDSRFEIPRFDCNDFPPVSMK